MARDKVLLLDPTNCLENIEKASFAGNTNPYMTNRPAPVLKGKDFASSEEVEAYDKLCELSKLSPIPDNEMLANLGLFLVRGSFVRLMFLHKLYLKSLCTSGVIMEFGVRWGQNLALFMTFRNIYEPYNLSRKIIGFDTWEGFPAVSPLDGGAPTARVGGLSVTPDYETYLEQILSAHQKTTPRTAIKQHQLIKGNVIETLPKYLKDHPETIISLAYFDMNLYEPTKKCLEVIKPHLAKNSIVGFDQLVWDEFPGETLALKEAWGLSDFEIIRDPLSPMQSYLVMG